MRVVEAASLSGHPENPEGASALGPAPEMDDAIAGLVELGWTKVQARARVTRARERLAENSGEAVDITPPWSVVRFLPARTSVHSITSLRASTFGLPSSFVNCVFRHLQPFFV